MSFLEASLLSKSIDLIDSWPEVDVSQEDVFWKYGFSTSDRLLQTDKDRFLQWAPGADGAFESTTVVREPLDDKKIVELMVNQRVVEGTNHLADAEMARKIVFRISYKRNHIYHIWLDTVDGWKLMHSPFALTSALPMEIDKSLGLAPR
ncbi:MAG: hypothetical protein WD716_05310 [Fimbriimonadaceae bacterium]